VGVGVFDAVGDHVDVFVGVEVIVAVAAIEVLVGRVVTLAEEVSVGLALGVAVFVGKTPGVGVRVGRKVADTSPRTIGIRGAAGSFSDIPWSVTGIVPA
jgi:hypothetical protein